MTQDIEVLTGDGQSNIALASDSPLEVFLEMHEKINAKNEEISKSYKDNLLITFDEIKELHEKNIQSIRSLRPINRNPVVRISVSHNEGESEKFNSFEEFEKHNISNSNPTLSIILTYIFTLKDQDSVNFENYKVVNQIVSRIAQIKQIEEEAPPFISRALITGLVTKTAKITIEYSDYVKARHFTAMFDEWIKGCDKADSPLINVEKRAFKILCQPSFLDI